MPFGTLEITSLILNKNSFAPYKVFYDFLETAQKNNQTAIDSICISSFNKNDNEVDAIAGATITGDGVSAMIKTDLRLYQSYFENLKTN